MDVNEQHLIEILKASPKTWRELVPSFKDRDALNNALLQTEKRGEVEYSLSTGLYYAVDDHD